MEDLEIIVLALVRWKCWCGKSLECESGVNDQTLHRKCPNCLTEYEIRWGHGEIEVDVKKVS